MCDLYYNENLKNITNIKSNLKEAEKQAQIVMMNIDNLFLMINIIKKYIYYLDEGVSDIISKAELSNLFINTKKYKSMLNNNKDKDKLEQYNLEFNKLDELENQAKNKNYI